MSIKNTVSDKITDVTRNSVDLFLDFNVANNVWFQSKVDIEDLIYSEIWLTIRSNVLDELEERYFS